MNAEREARETAEVASWTTPNPNECGYYGCWRDRWSESEDELCEQHQREQWAAEDEGERQAEQAVEAFYERGGDAWAAYAVEEDEEREREAAFGIVR